MNDIIQPESFSEFWGIWLFYVIVWGLMSTIVFFIIGAFGLTIFSVVTRQLSKLEARLGPFCAILIILLPIGGLFNAFWSCLVWGNLYVTYGADSPEDDFQPFLSPNQLWLDANHGHLLTVSMPELQLVWFFFAATAWAISFILYRLIQRKLAPAFAVFSHPPAEIA